GLDGKRLFIEGFDVSAGHRSEQSIQRAMFAIRGRKLESFVTEGLVGAKARMLARKPSGELTQDVSPLMQEETAAFKWIEVGRQGAIYSRDRAVTIACRGVGTPMQSTLLRSLDHCYMAHSSIKMVGKIQTN